MKTNSSRACSSSSSWPRRALSACWRLARRLRKVSADYEIHARMPENGGWSPETLHAEVGQPLRLRLTSDDVLHSFAIGQTGRIEPLDLLPGRVDRDRAGLRPPGPLYLLLHALVRAQPLAHARDHRGQRPGQPLMPPRTSRSTCPRHRYRRAAHQAQVVPAQPPSAERGAELGQPIAEPGLLS